MARPAFVNVPLTDVDTDSPGKTTDVFKALRDNAAAVRIGIFGVDIAEDGTASGTFQTVTGSEFNVELINVADYAGIVRKVILGIEGKVSGGATAEFRLFQITDSVAGTAVAKTDAAYVAFNIEIDVQTGWLGIAKQFRVEHRISSGAGTVNTRAVKRFSGRYEF